MLRALERMDAAWLKSEEHMAKLSINATRGLLRSTEVVSACAAAAASWTGADSTREWCGTSLEALSNTLAGGEMGIILPWLPLSLV